MFFLGIISWKGASRFNGGFGVASFLSGAGGAPWRGISFDGDVFEKIVGWGGTPPSPLCSPHYGKPCEDLEFLGGILKKYNVEIPEVT